MRSVSAVLEQQGTGRRAHGSAESVFLGKGGFRYSDTVITTADGAEVAIKAPRMLEELVVE